MIPGRDEALWEQHRYDPLDTFIDWEDLLARIDGLKKGTEKVFHPEDKKLCTHVIFRHIFE